MNEPPHLSAFDLDALLLDAGRSEDAGHAEACPRCGAALEAQRQLQQQLALQAGRSLEGVRGRLRGARRRAWLLWLTPFALAAAVVVLLPRTEATLGFKGGAALQAFARRGGEVFRVVEGASLAPGDELQLVVERAGLPYLLVASVDGAQHVSVYYPAGGGESGALPAGVARFELPNSVRLDAAAGPERVFALLSRAPLRVDEVAAALGAVGRSGAGAIRAQRTLPVPADLQASVCFEKRAP